jgi:hypothetical protein
MGKPVLVDLPHRRCCWFIEELDLNGEVSEGSISADGHPVQPDAKQIEQAGRGWHNRDIRKAD